MANAVAELEASATACVNLSKESAESKGPMLSGVISPTTSSAACVTHGKRPSSTHSGEAIKGNARSKSTSGSSESDDDEGEGEEDSDDDSNSDFEFAFADKPVSEALCMSTAGIGDIGTRTSASREKHPSRVDETRMSRRGAELVGEASAMSTAARDVDTVSGRVAAEVDCSGGSNGADGDGVGVDMDGSGDHTEIGEDSMIVHSVAAPNKSVAAAAAAEASADGIVEDAEAESVPPIDEGNEVVRDEDAISRKSRRLTLARRVKETRAVAEVDEDMVSQEEEEEELEERDADEGAGDEDDEPVWAGLVESDSDRQDDGDEDGDEDEDEDGDGDEDEDEDDNEDEDEDEEEGVCAR